MSNYSSQDFDIRGTVLVKYNGNAPHVTVPTGITVIGPKAFGDKPTLHTIELPDTVTAIQDQAFLNCPALEYVTIPQSVTELGQLLFWGSVQATVCTPQGSVAARYARDRRMKTIPDLPSTMRELGIPANWDPKDHPLFALRHWSNLRRLRGRVLITVYLVTDTVGTWTEVDAATYCRLHDTVMRDLEHEAYRRNIPLQIHTVYKRIKTTTKCTFEYCRRWLDRWGPQCPPDSTPGYDERPVMLVFNKHLRSFACKEISIIGTNRFSFNSRTICHELFHSFGAPDLYKPPKVQEVADVYLPNSVMNDGRTIDDLTAYCIGWTDTLSPEALIVLWETRNLKI